MFLPVPACTPASLPSLGATVGQTELVPAVAVVIVVIVLTVVTVVIVVIVVTVVTLVKVLTIVTVAILRFEGSYLWCLGW